MILSIAVNAGLQTSLTLGLFFSNRCPLEFSLSGQGVLMSNVSERARLVHRLSWILPLLTGRPLMAGSGLITQSKETVVIRWEDVTSVRRCVDDGVVTVRGGFLDKVRLYCTGANYAEVAARIESEVRKHSPSAVIA